MEKRNVVENGRTPCRKITGNEFCDCDACKAQRKTRLLKTSAVAPKSIMDVQGLSEEIR